MNRPSIPIVASVATVPTTYRDLARQPRADRVREPVDDLGGLAPARQRREIRLHGVDPGRHGGRQRSDIRRERDEDEGQGDDDDQEQATGHGAGGLEPGPPARPQAPRVRRQGRRQDEPKQE